MPLLLTLIATVHRFRGTLPGKRVELYAEICEVFLGKRNEARGVASELSPAQKKLVLQQLAWTLMVERVREVSYDTAIESIRGRLTRVSPTMLPDAFLRDVQGTTGLLLEREAGVWTFAHKTFQEYLAAVEAREQGLESKIVSSVGEDWWHETVRLCSALGDGTRVISACAEGQPPNLSALVLAVQCADEALQVDPQVRARLSQLIDEEIDSDDWERRSQAARCWLEYRARTMERIADGVFGDRRFISRAEYQLFVDEEAAAGRDRRPIGHLGPEATNPRSPATGVRGIDALAFCEWMTRRGGGAWVYRLPTFDELLELADVEEDGALASWHQDPGGEVSCIPTLEPNRDDQTARFEAAIAKDFDQLRATSSDTRRALGLEISDEDAIALIRFHEWAAGGAIQAGARLLEEALTEWPTRWWWRGSASILRAGRWLGMPIWRALLWVVRAGIRFGAFVWGPADSQSAEHIGRATGQVVSRVVVTVLRGATWLFTPLKWIFGGIVARAFQRRVEAERERMAREGRPQPSSATALAALIEERGADEGQVARSLADLVLLVMVHTLMGLAVRASGPQATRGNAIVSLGELEGVPEPLAKLARRLAARSDADLSQEADVAWATRMSLLFWWRHSIVEALELAIRSKGQAFIDPGDGRLAVVFDAWLDAWAVTERISGAVAPFEKLRIVKERRHAD